MYFHQAIATYLEIIRTGQIQSAVEGDEVRIQVQGSISGDILIFISPRQALSEGQSTLSLVVSDSTIEKQLPEVMKQFRTKFRGLYFLPQGIAWIINIIFISIFTWRFYHPVIMAFTAHDISEALSYVAPPDSDCRTGGGVFKRNRVWDIKTCNNCDQMDSANRAPEEK